MIVATSSPIKWRLGSELIKLEQRTSFSHVLIIKGDLVFQASHGYVNCVYIDNFLKDNKIIHSYTVPDESVDMDFVYKQLGKKYSIMQILEIALRYLTGIKILINNRNNQFICSEYVGKALRLDWVTDFTTPVEIDSYLRSIKSE